MIKQWYIIPVAVMSVVLFATQHVYGKGSAEHSGVRLLSNMGTEKTDADRIQDVHRIAEICEKFKEKTGYYPYAELFEDVEDGYVAVPVAVNIYHDELPEQYKWPPLGRSGTIVSTEEFLSYLEKELGEKVELPYDGRIVEFKPPYVPTFYQYLYNGRAYFVSAILTAPTQHTRELFPGYYKYQVGSVEVPSKKILKYLNVKTTFGN